MSHLQEASLKNHTSQRFCVLSPLSTLVEMIIPVIRDIYMAPVTLATQEDRDVLMKVGTVLVNKRS